MGVQGRERVGGGRGGDGRGGDGVGSVLKGGITVYIIYIIIKRYTLKKRRRDEEK